MSFEWWRVNAMRHGRPVLGDQPRREALIMTLRKILRDNPPGKRIVVGRVLIEAIVEELNDGQRTESD